VDCCIATLSAVRRRAPRHAEEYPSLELLVPEQIPALIGLDVDATTFAANVDIARERIRVSLSNGAHVAGLTGLRGRERRDLHIHVAKRRVDLTIRFVAREVRRVDLVALRDRCDTAGTERGCTHQHDQHLWPNLHAVPHGTASIASREYDSQRPCRLRVQAL
jgi:hypothetical protein